MGIGNHKLFLLFLLWVNVVCAYALVLTICKYSFCRPAGGPSSNDCGTAMQNLMAVFLLVEASLFGLFTVCMMGDQSSVLTTNQTKIDALKGVHTSSGVDDFNEVFGCSNDVSFNLDWLIPVRAVFPDHVRDRVMGYHVAASPSGGGGGDAETEASMPLTGGASLEMHDLQGGSVRSEEDLARGRLGSAELWGVNESNIDVPFRGDRADNFRRRSGPPF